MDKVLIRYLFNRVKMYRNMQVCARISFMYLGGQMGGYGDLFSNGSRIAVDRIHLLANGSLLLHKTTPTDDGFYLCQATNGIFPDISKLIHLVVHSKLRLVALEYTGNQINY